MKMSKNDVTINNVQNGVIICAVAVIFIIGKMTKVNNRLKKALAMFPGPKTYPIFGNVFEFCKPTHELLSVCRNMSEVYGKTFCVWMCHIPKLIITDPVAIEKIVTSSDAIEKSQDYDVNHPWIGTGLITSSGNKWRSRRKLITPTFHFKILGDFVDVFNEHASVFVDILSTERAETKKEFDIMPLLKRCILDSICETAMGKKVQAQVNSESEYVRSVSSYQNVLMQRILKPWLRPQMIWKFTSLARLEKKYLTIIHGLSEKVIKERKRDRQLLEGQKCDHNSTVLRQDDGIKLKTKKRSCFLDLLLDAAETNESLSVMDIREEVDTFIYAGHDTTSTTIGWTLFLLGKHPEIQRRAQRELDDILGEERNTRITMANVSSMEYLNCCIKESLRLYPAIPVFARRIHRDIDLGNGLVAPAGINCYVSPYLVHRDSKVFPEPDKFDPDRFLLKNCEGRSPYSYIPFSAGYRNCIGQKYAMLELKIILAQLLKAFSFEALDNVETLRIDPDIVLKPKDGLRFRIYSR